MRGGKLDSLFEGNVVIFRSRCNSVFTAALLFAQRMISSTGLPLLRWSESSFQMDDEQIAATSAVVQIRNILASSC